MTDLKEIYTEWQNNPAFRKQFNNDPVQALNEAGFDVSPEDLVKIKSMLKLDKSGNGKLDDRITK